MLFIYFKRLEKNWYDDLKSLETLTEKTWLSMNLPIRFYHQLRLHFQIGENLNKDNSNLKGLEGLPNIKDVELEKEILCKGIENLQINESQKEEAFNSQKKLEIDSTIEIDKEKNSKFDSTEEAEKDKRFESGSIREIDLVSHLGDIKDFEEAIDILNNEGEKEGVTFKRGNIHYNSDKTIRYRSIVCGYKDRHPKIKDNKPDSLSSQQNFNAKSCEVYYRFEVKREEIVLLTYFQIHNGHKFKIKRKELTSDMITDLKNFNKRSKINEIKDFLETKYKAELSYRIVYHEFRKIFPLLGPQDAKVFIEFCLKNGFDCLKTIDNEQQTYTKIFITSNLMKNHYKAYGDVLIVDATYRVNKYYLPLVIFSGFTHTGRNCLFGVAIVNNETEDTYSWVFDSFFKSVGHYPKILVSDQDSSITAVISKNYVQNSLIKYHLHCSWHIQQNLKKNCSYLATMKLGDLRDRIINLPFIRMKQEFDECISEIMMTLSKKKLEKTITYLESHLINKEKCARAYLPMEFTGGVHTTSRAESMNSLIKRYVDSGSEIVDFFRFLIDYERKNFLTETKLQLNVINQYEKHPILVSLKQFLFGIIYDKHFEQFSLSHNYYVKRLNNETTDDILFEIKSNEAKNPNQKRLAKIIEGKYTCTCETYIREGILCRHIFSICIVNQEKDLTKIARNPRWKSPTITLQTYDNYAFDDKLLQQYQKKTEEESKGEIIEEAFRKNERRKGAPRKEKRTKSVLEAPKTNTTKAIKKTGNQKKTNRSRRPKSVVQRSKSSRIEEVEKENMDKNNKEMKPEPRKIRAQKILGKAQDEEVSELHQKKKVKKNSKAQNSS